MKNFTLKMKSVLFCLFAVFAMASPAKAELSSVSDLFGKYKFSAKIEYLDKAYEGKYKENSDVTIKKHAIYDGEIVGLAGQPVGQLINTHNDDTLVISNPSQNGVWGDLYMANAKGDYPFNGVLEDHKGKSFSAEYIYNAADGSISIPDFTLGKGDYQAETFTVCVKFTNVKLELVELDKVDIVDLSGDWHFKAVEGGFNTNTESTIPTEFDFSLVAKDENKKTYTAKLTIGEFAPVELAASFNGSEFGLQLDSTALDEAEHIYLIPGYSKNPYHDVISFNYTTSGTLSLTSGMNIVRKDSIAPEKPKAQLQWYMAGVAKRLGGDVAKFTWDGTFNFEAENVFQVAPGANYPQKFSMKVEETEYGFFVKEIFGKVVPQGGFSLVPDEKDPKKAVIPAGYAGFRNLGSIEAGKTYYVWGDQDGKVAGDIHLVLNDDNTITMDNTNVLVYDYVNKTAEVYSSYIGVKGTKEAAPEVPEFSWTQTFNVTADVQAINKEYEYPTEFKMTVVTNETTGDLMMTEFYADGFANLNYGGAAFTVSEKNPMEAEIKAGITLKSIEPGKLYLVMADMNAQAKPVKVTADAEGNLTIQNFAVMLKNYDTQESTTAASYSNVKAVPVPATGIESVQKEDCKICISAGVVYFEKAQAVQVYNYAGKCVFNGVTAEVSGLAKGLYIVKTAAGAAKVVIK